VKKEKMAMMSTFLKRFADEDIMCLQEVGPFAVDLLKKNYANYQMHNIGKGAIILSKHPIVKRGEIPFGTKTNSCVWADVIINLDTFRVYSLHLQSNKISKDADDMVHSATLNDKKTWLGIKGILKKYRFHHIKRAQQAKMVKAHIQNSKYPVIVCGDFNDTPLSFTYSHISKGLVDAFNERGTGIGTTYSGTIPFLRIDYILTSPFLRPLRFQVIKEKHSDHYPIAAVYTYDKVKE
jgi:endonuclease/exonuclease/phosphatase family metal-dependent hydrolase